MEKKQVIEAIKKVRENSKQRKFAQSVDLVINLKNVDVKTLKLADSVSLPSGRGKAVKVAAIVDGEGVTQAKSAGAELVLSKKELSNYDKKTAKKASETYEWFVVQAHLMQPFASVFGASLGSKGKMPFPRDIVPPTKDPSETIKRLRNSVRIKIKKEPVVHTVVGIETMSDDELAENILAVYNTVLHKLEKGIHSMGAVFVKTTMGKAVKV